MKKHKKKPWAPPAPRIHESKEDRSRTPSGKTASSKIRNEGRALAALERSALAQRGRAALEAKQLAAGIPE
jgi:hypothetical protein